MVVVLAGFGVGLGAASASAATFAAECSNLQTKITEVAKEAKQGEGDVIVLNGLCDETSLGNSSGVTLPTGSNFSIEGKPGTTSGFDGAGITGPLLGNAASTEAGAITISHLTFQHADLTDASALSLRASRVTLSDDSFLDNVEHGETAHAAFISVGATPSNCPSPTGTTAITLTGSTFLSNKLVLGNGAGGGAGAWIQDECPQSRTVLEGNSFEGNILEGTGTADGAQVTGAGLRFVGSEPQPTPVSQSGNMFDSNSIRAPAPDLGNYGGGGEWLEYASLLSIGDRFSRNDIAGTSSTSGSVFAWSWGAGLGIYSENCNRAALPESTLEDAIVAGNAIEAGTTEDLGGGGVWVGCSHLRVLDSTVTLNTAPSGAGIEGEPFDRLELANSIVAEDSPGNETGGFVESEGGSVTASFSDICAYAGSSEPLPGAGNICADPLLADNGEPASFDVHETASSPTIDAGSNALVPGGLTTDAFGTTRILAGHAGCTGNFPAIVDMGAAEFQPTQPLCPPVLEQSPTAASAAQPTALAPGLTHFVSLELSPTGIALKLSCSSADGRRCSGSIFVTSNEILRGKKIVAVSASKRTKAPVRIAQASFSLGAGSTATIHVKLNSTGLRLLRRFHAFSAWVLANEAMSNNSQVIFFLHDARFSEPKEKPKKSKSTSPRSTTGRRRAVRVPREVVSRPAQLGRAGILAERIAAEVVELEIQVEGMGGPAAQMPGARTREHDHISRPIVELHLAGSLEYHLGKLVRLQARTEVRALVECVHATMLVGVEHERGLGRNVDRQTNRYLRREAILVGRRLGCGVRLVTLDMALG